MAKLWQTLQGYPKPAFSEKVQTGTKRNFSKIAQKVALALKPKKTLRQMPLTSNLYALIAPRLEKILEKTAAPNLPE